jgi:Tfp pilus assembly protein PilX
MTILSRKKNPARSAPTRLTPQRGVTVLIMTVLLLLSATLIVIFAAQYSLTQARITSNQYRNMQAYEAAQAGLEYGIAYLIQNSATILATPSGGHILPYTSATTTNVTQSNNSKYSIVYTNPISANYNLILITSTGTSDDGTSTRVAQQEVEAGSTLLSPSSYVLVTTQKIALSGGTTVTNTITNQTLEAGSSVAGSGSFKTVTSSGTTSTSGNFGSDITQNVTSLANTSAGDLFSDFFGMTEAQYTAKVAHTYTSNSNYATTLNGMTGTTIYINAGTGSANFSGSTTIGSPTAPVLIVIDGNLNISGSLTLYGFLFVHGASTATTNLSGTINITGGIATTDNVSASGTLNMTYDNAVLGNVQAATSYFARVPGSWKDF